MGPRQLILISWSAVAPLIANMRELLGILRILSILISGTQKGDELSPHNKSETLAGEIDLEKTTKIYFNGILRAIQHEEGREKNDRNLDRIR